jgi:hypothetical protein
MQLNRYPVSCAALTGSSSQARVGKNSSLAIDSALALHEMSCSLCSWQNNCVKIADNMAWIFSGTSLAQKSGSTLVQRRLSMKKVHLLMLATVFTAALLGIGVQKPLFAQATPGQPANLDEQQLRSFAKVYVQVEKLRETYAPRAKEATGPEEGKQIQQEAQSEFQKVLTKEGLTEESYTKIFQVASADQDVRKKVLQMIAEEKGKS